MESEGIGDPKSAIRDTLYLSISNTPQLRRGVTSRIMAEMLWRGAA